MSAPMPSRPQLGTIQESGMSDVHLSISDSSSQDLSPPAQAGGKARDDEYSDDEEFIYPGVDEQHLTQSDEPLAPQISSQTSPSPAQLEALYAAASSGDLPQLKRLFQNALETGEVQPFSLANHASTRTGFTALHAAASRGYLDIVIWLVEECGAMPNWEDKEGETALHKAALHGHLPIVTYLLPSRADVHARDADGWTALHNACSKGYLDIVRWLCEAGGAATFVHGVRGIDIRSKGGWTPLMNASSKGHLPVVLYLLNKQSANPLVRNNWGETAFDAAAAVFEIWICEVLQKAEAEKWKTTTVPYNPLSVHVAVPLIIYENQRLDTRFKTLATSGGRPRFSASGLGKHGRRAPFELKLPMADEETGDTIVSAWRSDVQLPSRDDPWVLPKIEHRDRPALDGAEKSHFWLSDWTLDVTHPGVDAEEGWQYAHRFSDPDDHWTADKPPQLERHLMGSSSASASLSSLPSPSQRVTQSWVRRRRWVRVMRRRLDIPPLPFLEPDGNMYHLDAEGSMIPFIPDQNSEHGDGEGQELGSMPSTLMSAARDYVARARYMVGTQSPITDGAANEPVSAIDARRAIAKLERATSELRQGILGDDDAERKIHAEVLLNAYSRDLDRRRLAAGANGLLISGADDDEHGDAESSSDEEFHYPGSSSIPSTRPESIASSFDYFSRSSNNRIPTDLTPQLAQSPEFRVPTHETPQKVLVPRWTPPTPHQVHAQWERDSDVHACRACSRRFNFINRRHCRRCGRIFCDRCSSYRTILDPSDIVHDPFLAEDGTATASSQRVCQACYDVVNASVPSGLHSTRTTSMERIVVEQAQLAIPSHISRDQSSSQLSDLADCPVCGQNLSDLGSVGDQETHVKHCLEGGSGTTPQVAKYLVYRLPAESVLIGIECVICLEEFAKGSLVARLSCLCSFHNACLSSWLQRGRSCPVHAR